MELAAQAFDVPEEARSRFIAEACKGDETLRSEVAAIVEADARACAFLERPAIESLGSRTETLENGGGICSCAPGEGGGREVSGPS